MFFHYKILTKSKHYHLKTEMVKQMEKETTSNNKLTPSYPTIYFHRMNLLTPQLFSANSPGPPPPPPNPASPKSVQSTFPPASIPTPSFALSACLPIWVRNYMVTIFWDLSWYSRKKKGKKKKKTEAQRKDNGGNGSQVADNITEIQDLIGQEWRKLKVLRGANFQF